MFKSTTLALVQFCIGLAFLQPLQAEECCPEETCGSCKRLWADAEYLHWKIKDSPKPVPLVVAIPEDGRIKNVLGGNKIRTDWRSGGKFTVGYWSDDSCCLGAEVSYFFLPYRSRTKTVSSDGDPILLVPFFNVVTDQQEFAGLAIPEEFRATTSLRVGNKMQGAELNVVTACPIGCLNIGFLIGFRYWNFDERLRFDTDSPFVPPNPPDIFFTKDKFRAENNFYGGQLGAGCRFQKYAFFMDLRAKIALGGLYQRSHISGKFTTNDFNNFGAPQTFEGAYFALPTNIGHHKRTRFSVLPEININFGYEIAECLHIQVGYSFLYVSNVLWSTKQISKKINPTQSAIIAFTPTPELVGEAKPKAKLRAEGLWAQGLNVGLVYKF